MELALESTPKYRVSSKNTESAPDAQGRVRFGAGSRVSSKIQSQRQRLRADSFRFGAGFRVSAILQSQFPRLRTESALELALESAPKYRVSSRGSGQSQLLCWL